MISNDHLVQMQWQMACTERPWCDYVSFNPDFPAHMQIWIKRVERNNGVIRELTAEIAAFIKEIDRKVEQLSRRYAAMAA
jgi:hypothetical protein